MIVTSPPTPQKAADWAGLVNAVADDVERWSDELGWATHRSEKRIDHGPDLGILVLPFVRVRTPYGQLHLDPDGLWIVGAEARMTLEGWPAQGRAILLGRDGRWTVYDDHMVPHAQPWSRGLFERLADDLLRVPK